jgi:multidrug resistance efflux pump
MQEAPSREVFAKCWLILQCTQLAGASRGVIVLGAAEHGPFAPVAFWPEGKGGNLGLTTVAELALQERRGVLKDSRNSASASPSRADFCHIAYPFLIDGQLHGVVAVELAARSEPALRAAMRQLQWGAAWLELRLRREEKRQVSPENRRLATALDWLAVCVEGEHFQDAATALVTDMATALGCERVSLGFLAGRNIRVRALSHSAHFSRKSGLVDLIGAAMDEAMDQRATLLYPPRPDETVRLTQSQARLSEHSGQCTVCTVPISRNGRVIGGLTLERPADRPFDTDTVELCEAVASMAGPILEDRLQNDQWLVVKIGRAAKTQVEHLVGPGHLGLKVGTALSLMIVLFFCFATGDYRVAADTKIEGAIQRAVTAPFDGYVMEAPVRAGDVVRQNDLMARMDDRDLQLQRTKWASQREQYLRQYRDALAKSSWADVSVLKAQVGQAGAELALVEEQLARSRITAPLAGLVVSGDLSQALGSPVARGDVLFEVAPLDAYRVILEVDESDMKDVEVGQRGDLVLAGESSAVLPFAVQKITPVSESREGRNFFRVEAHLDETPVFLRPGMKGVGKIEIGERKLIWIWTHKLIDWLRLWFWRFWP